MSCLMRLFGRGSPTVAAVAHFKRSNEYAEDSKMSENELLARAKEEHERVSRIITSQHSEEERPSHALQASAGTTSENITDDDILEFLQSFRDYGQTVDEYDRLLAILLKEGECALSRNSSYESFIKKEDYDQYMNKVLSDVGDIEVAKREALQTVYLKAEYWDQTKFIYHIIEAREIKAFSLYRLFVSPKIRIKCVDGELSCNRKWLNLNTRIIQNAIKR